MNPNSEDECITHVKSMYENILDICLMHSERYGNMQQDQIMEMKRWYDRYMMELERSVDLDRLREMERKALSENHRITTATLFTSKGKKLSPAERTHSSGLGSGKRTTIEYGATACCLAEAEVNKTMYQMNEKWVKSNEWMIEDRDIFKIIESQRHDEKKSSKELYQTYEVNYSKDLMENSHLANEKMRVITDLFGKYQMQRENERKYIRNLSQEIENEKEHHRELFQKYKDTVEHERERDRKATDESLQRSEQEKQRALQHERELFREKEKRMAKDRENERQSMEEVIKRLQKDQQEERKRQRDLIKQNEECAEKEIRRLRQSYDDALKKANDRYQACAADRVTAWKPQDDILQRMEADTRRARDYNRSFYNQVYSFLEQTTPSQPMQYAQASTVLHPQGQPPISTVLHPSAQSQTSAVLLPPSQPSGTANQVEGNINNTPNMAAYRYQ